MQLHFGVVKTVGWLFQKYPLVGLSRYIYLIGTRCMRSRLYMFRLCRLPIDLAQHQVLMAVTPCLLPILKYPVVSSHGTIRLIWTRCMRSLGWIKPVASQTERMRFESFPCMLSNWQIWMICCMTAKILPPPHSLAQHQMHTQSRFYRHLPGSKLLPELVTPQLKGHVLCLRTAVHRRCWRPPKGLGTNKTVELTQLRRVSRYGLAVRR